MDIQEKSHTDLESEISMRYNEIQVFECLVSTHGCLYLFLYLFLSVKLYLLVSCLCVGRASTPHSTPPLLNTYALSLGTGIFLAQTGLPREIQKTCHFHSRVHTCLFSHLLLWEQVSLGPSMEAGKSLDSHPGPPAI